MKKRFGTLLAAVSVLVAVNAGALSLDELVAGLGSMSEIRTAELAVAQARANLENTRYFGDATFGLTPSASISPASTGVSGEISGTATVSLPVGPADSKESAVAVAESALSAAERTIESARDWAYLRLVRLYTTAWLAQEELSVLSLERASAGQRLLETQALFESGRVSSSTVTAAEAELDKRTTAIQQGTLAARISRLELAYAAGLSPVSSESLDPPVLDDVKLLPPPQLTSWAETADPTIIAQREKIERLQSERDDPAGAPIISTLKTTFSANPHTASITYNPSAASISGSYSFPVWSFSTVDDEPALGSNATTGSWSVGVSVGLSVSTAGSEARADAVLDAEIAAEQARLELLLDALALSVRSRYQQYVIGREAVAAAEDAHVLTEETLEQVAAQRADARATEADFADATSRNARAAFSATEALVKQHIAALTAASAASYISQIIGE